MYFYSALIVFLSAASLTLAQANTCQQLKGYQPALAYCSARYPQPVPTLTHTTTKTVTVKATSSLTTSTTKSVTTTTSKPATTTTSTKPVSTTTSSRPNTTSATGNGKIRTITAVVEHTVTNCDNVPPPPCAKTNSPVAPVSPNNNGRPSWPANPPTSPAWQQNRPSWGRVGSRNAEPEPEPQFGGFSFGNLSPLLWARVMASGTNGVKSLCACILPVPNRTVTVSATATVTATVKA